MRRLIGCGTLFLDLLGFRGSYHDPRTVLDFLIKWWNWLGKHLSNIWNLVPLCLMWCIRRERNRQTFEDVESLGDQLLASFHGFLFD